MCSKMMLSCILICNCSDSVFHLRDFQDLSNADDKDLGGVGGFEQRRSDGLGSGAAPRGPLGVRILRLFSAPGGSGAERCALDSELGDLRWFR